MGLLDAYTNTIDCTFTNLYVQSWWIEKIKRVHMLEKNVCFNLDTFLYS